MREYLVSLKDFSFVQGINLLSKHLKNSTAYLCSSWLKHSCQYLYLNEYRPLFFFLLLIIQGGQKWGEHKKHFRLQWKSQLLKNELRQKLSQVITHTSKEHVADICQIGGEYVYTFSLNSLLRFCKIKINWEMKLMVLKSKRTSNKCRTMSFHWNYTFCWNHTWLWFFLWISEKWQCFCIKITISILNDMEY